MAKTLIQQYAACSARIRTAGDAIQLFPAGQFRARDGRPAGLPGWQMDASIARQLIERAEQTETPYVIDYDHQTLKAETSGNPAPAAAWFDRLEWRDDGLYAVGVEWTERARQLIESDEYRYISPVFTYDKATGAVTGLVMAGITNYPAIDGIADVAAARMAQPHEEDAPVDEETLALLGLSGEATEEEIRAAIRALVEKAAQVEEAQAAARANPDPEKFAPMSELITMQHQFTALSAQIQSAEVEQLVSDGLADGRLLNSMEDWARDLGKNNVAALRSYLDQAQPIAALQSQQTKDKRPDGEESAKLTEEELAVCRAMNQSPEDFLKFKGATEERTA